MGSEHKPKRTFSIPQLECRPTGMLCIFIGAGESVILIEIAEAEENPKTGRRLYDRVKHCVECVIRYWRLLVFVWGTLFGM